MVAPRLDAPPPSAFGLPYEEWRPGQWEMVCGILDSPHPFHLVVAPTGFGKSLLYMALSALGGEENRAVCLTATKALQDQLNHDFGGGKDDGSGPLGLYDVRGRSAYSCVLRETIPSMAHLVRPGATAANAPCRWGMACPLTEGGCPYYDRVKWAHAPRLLVTNYDFWLYNPQRHGETKLLVMDEAHQAPGELADFFSFKFSKEMLRYFDKRHPDSEEVDVWAEWYGWATRVVEGQLAKHKGGKPPDDLLDLSNNLSKMGRMGMGEWVVERLADGSWAFDCINPEKFGATLWGDVIRAGGKVVMVSATANAMTARAIGVDPGQIKIWEAGSGFPIERRPVWAVNGAIQVNYRMQEAQKRLWVTLIDRVIGPRLAMGRKGIIHTTSFERARYLQQYSQHASKLLLNESRNTREVVANFKRSRVGVALVSPSVTTGYDFPYDECRWQVIGKVPFPDLRSKAAKVKAERNKEWAGYMAAQELVQSAGRGMRGPEDWCETIIADGSFGWWWKANRKWTPKWFQEAVGWAEIGRLPEPLDIGGEE